MLQNYQTTNWSK